MSKKPELYRQLKSLGVEFPKPYVELTVDDLEEIAAQEIARDESAVEVEGLPDYEEFQEAMDSQAREIEANFNTQAPQIENVPVPAVTAPTPPAESDVTAVLKTPQNLQELESVVIRMFQSKQLQEGAEVPFRDTVLPVLNRGAERAGLAYSTPDDVPIRIDTSARIWFIDEVAKPAIPKARMTRKTRYIDPGVKQVRSFDQDGRLDEVYEVAGEERRELTTTVTLPSWQTGKFKDVRFPFLIHVYNEARGFDYLAVNRFYGGRDFVPGTIKTLYVGNQLCYDIPSTRAAIDAQFAQMKRNF